METLQINKGNALTAYDKGSQPEKNLLENLFGKQTFSRKITDRVKTYEDACAVLGIDPNASLPYLTDADGDIAFLNATAKLVIIVRALNEGWTPDWSNSSQYKHYPWFRANPAGSGFSFRVCVFDCTLSNVGSRLVFKSEELAKYAGTQFLDIYNQFLSL